MSELKTSEEWFSEICYPRGISLVDTSGWDDVNFDYVWFHEKITKQEFLEKLMNSTVVYSYNNNNERH